MKEHALPLAPQRLLWGSETLFLPDRCSRVASKTAKESHLSTISIRIGPWHLELEFDAA